MPEIVALLRAAGVQVDDTDLTRALYAHDASNYRITPTAVAFPASTEEVVQIVRACSATKTPITARGSGTGMAGNTVGSGIVIDFRRQMHAIHAIDAANRTATVDPGVVLEDLQQAAAPHELMFGPDPSSRSRATLGGMIGNDACGNHSVAYGRTSAHVLELQLVLADGTQAIATRTGIRAADPADGARLQTLVAHLHAVAATRAPALRTEFDRCPRQVSGYAAHRLLPEHDFDIARLLVGSEGSLAIVTRATVALVERPRETELLVVGYRSLVDAARDVPTLLEYAPSAIEAIDTAIVQTMRARRGSDAVPAMPDGDAWLFVEFSDTVARTDIDALAQHIRALGRSVSTHVVHEANERAALWRVREDGAGLASSLLDGTRGRPGWEDAAVPPERLAEYLERMEALAQRHELRGVLYGHFGAGCVHIRYDFDLDSAAGQERMRTFITDAARIVASCGGSISGEHGDGRARGALLSHMYSPDALAAFRDIKHAFDPECIFNPGILVDAPSPVSDLQRRGHRDAAAFALREDHADLAIAAARCVGVGRCVTTTLSAMCPTHAVTAREQDSTRGRARALQDVYAGELELAEAIAALDSCLGCKACATDCPTGVDMTTYKAEALYEFYAKRRRPITHYTLGWLPRITPIAQRFSALANGVLSTRAVQQRMARLTGVAPQRRIPQLASRSSAERLRRMKPLEPDALLFIDSTTRAFRTEVAEAALRVLSAAGVSVQVVSEGCCGLTYISSGQLDLARDEQRRLLNTFASAPRDIPIIVLEPSCAAAMAHDLPELVRTEDATAVAQRIRTFAEALDQLAPAWTWPPLTQRVILQTHCHERATFTKQSSLLRRHGVAVQETEGCCGMAGAFGYEAQHYDLSVAVAERSLLPALDAHHADTVLTDGFGCACQVSDLRPDRTPLHLAQLLDQALRNSL